MEHEDERVNDAAGARQLDFEVPSRHKSKMRLRPEEHVPLCVVCGRSRARLTLARNHGQAPVKLCLRCHHAVMRQRKMLRAGLLSTGNSVPASAGPASRVGVGGSGERKHRVAGDAGLIVPRDGHLSGDAKYAVLTRHRRRAQVAARRALELELGSEHELLPAQGPNLLDRAS